MNGEGNRDIDQAIHPNIHATIIQAIEGKNFVTLVLHGHEVAGEPHVYGMRGGKPILVALQRRE